MNRKYGQLAFGSTQSSQSPLDQVADFLRGQGATVSPQCQESLRTAASRGVADIPGLYQQLVGGGCVPTQEELFGEEPDVASPTTPVPTNAPVQGQTGTQYPGVPGWVPWVGVGFLVYRILGEL